MKKLTVTFDNGPDPECTPEVLDILAEREVRASFFVCGQGNSLHPAKRARTAEARAILERHQSEARLQIDGGIKASNIAGAAQAGADTFVAGSAIFGADDYRATIGAMRAALENVS